MTPETYEITLEKFVYGGETMGRLPDGRAVFVLYGLPGERVRIQLTFQKRGFARGKILEILEASPERIEPKCKHFFRVNRPSVEGAEAKAYSPLSKGEGLGVRAEGAEEITACRGCHYQHLPYETQLRAKEEILRDQLVRIGKIEKPPVKEIIPSPENWQYRNQMEFQLGKDGKIKTPLLEGGEGMKYGGKITECRLPAPVLNDFWQQLDFGSNELVEYISLRHDLADNLMLVVHSNNPETPEMTLKSDLSVVHVTDEESIVMGGDDHTVIMLHERPLRVSASVFSHPNTAVAEKMITHLLETLPLTPDTTLLELHSGIGLFSAFLASQVGRLVCVEESAPTCDDFSINLDEFENVELYQAATEAVLPSIDFTPNIILIDPPVSGLGRQTLDEILRLSPATLTYISRDPSTLARDAARLIAGGYHLDAVTPFDVAPQTAQIDSIVIFTKK